MLNHDDILEFQIYGWFAHEKYKEDYTFIMGDETSTVPIAAKVNQIPPDYCYLDKNCQYEQFKSYKYLAFWSHWELAERKMIEFFEDSQIDHFGKIIVRADRRPLMMAVEPNDITNGKIYLTGAFSDGWMKKQSKFLVNLPIGCQSIKLEIMVPQNPATPEWQLSGSISVGDLVSNQPFNFQPGQHCIITNFQPLNQDTSQELNIIFDGGFFYPNSPDIREFFAHLRSISW